MANHGYQTHALCLLAMLMWKGLSLSFLNQSLTSLRYPSLFWFMVQFDQRTSIYKTDPSPLQCRSSLVMSILWNRDVLLCRRFVSGAFSHRRWIFRLSTGDCSLTRWYGGFIWVFDPGIKVLADVEDVVKLVLNGITPSYLMEKKKNSLAQWFTSRDSVSLSVFAEEEKYVSDPSVSNRKTKRLSKRIRMIRLVAFHRTTAHDDFERLFFSFNKLTSKWLHQFSYSWIGILRLQVNISKYGRDSFTKQWKDKKESVMIAEIYDRLLVVATKKSMGDRNRWKLKSEYFRRTLIRSHRFHVNISDSFSEASDFSMRCALWSFSKEMLLTHTFHIRERSKMEKDIANYSGSMEKRGMVINQHQWVGRYRRHDREPFQATYQSIRLIRVMRKAFRSFIYKMLAFYKYMKRGLNRFHLLPVRLPFGKQGYFHFFIENVFNFLYLFQWLYSNGSMYHVSCNTFML